jgi:parallel beta-helix repeat protein
VTLIQSTASRIVDGSATDNRYMGVLLLHFSDDNEIRNDAISGSTLTPGLVLDESSRNRVEKNVIEDNDEGIASFGGDNNGGGRFFQAACLCRCGNGAPVCRGWRTLALA